MQFCTPQPRVPQPRVPQPRLPQPRVPPPRVPQPRVPQPRVLHVGRCALEPRRTTAGSGTTRGRDIQDPRYKLGSPPIGIVLD